VLAGISVALSSKWRHKREKIYIVPLPVVVGVMFPGLLLFAERFASGTANI